MPAPIRLMVFEGYQGGYGRFNRFGAALYRPEIAYGAAGEYVAEAQKYLSDALQRQIAVDGVFGDETKAAVVEFQEKNNLAANGIIGKDTWTALIGAEVTTVMPEKSQNDGDISLVGNGAPADTGFSYWKIAAFAALGFVAYRALKDR